jgi:hypothetical protein
LETEQLLIFFFTQNDLDGFLAVAEQLAIKGLTSTEPPTSENQFTGGEPTVQL